MIRRAVWAEAAAAALLCAALAGQGILAAKANAPTADEFAHHVANGFTYLVTGDFRMNPASPPLPRALSAAPLLATGVRAPLEHPSWSSGDSPAFAREFFYRSGADADTLLFLARMPILGLSLILGLCVYVWTRRRWGRAAGLLALALYVFCPDVVAHSSLATADLAAALFFFLTITRFGAYLEAPTAGRLVLCGVAAGLMFLSKFSALLLLPLLPAIALTSGRLRAVAPAKTAGFLLAAALTVWAGYAFECKPLLERTPDPVKKAAEYRRIGGERLVTFAQKVPVPLSTFASALVSMCYTRSQGTNAYLLGEWSREGWWYYYFAASAVKHTIPFLAALAAALLAWPRLKAGRLNTALIGVPILLFFALTLGDKAQAGTRYFLPLVPLMCAAAGAGLACLARQGLARMALVLALVGWHAVEALSVSPYPLTYFNQIAGGPANGYKWLRDSNLDWGQGLKPLGRLARERGYGQIALQYPWPADPEYYGIRYRVPAADEQSRPLEDVYAISVHSLDSFAWTASREPDAVVAHSIHVYDLRRARP